MTTEITSKNAVIGKDIKYIIYQRLRYVRMRRNVAGPEIQCLIIEEEFHTNSFNVVIFW